MTTIVVGLGLFFGGVCLGAGIALWWVIQGDIRSGDQSIRPYDDDLEGWK